MKTWNEAVIEAKEALRPIFPWMTDKALQRAAEGRARMLYSDLAPGKDGGDD